MGWGGVERERERERERESEIWMDPWMGWDGMDGMNESNLNPNNSIIIQIGKENQR